MLVGYPPFFSDTPSETCQKIVKWKQYFTIPLDAKLSHETESLIRKMVAPADCRLGFKSVEEIKKHPFFKGFDWNNIGRMKPPFIPSLKNDWDTVYFDTFPEQDPFYPIEKKVKKRKNIDYPGYTYNRDLDNHRGGLLQALEVLDTLKISNKEINEVILYLNLYIKLEL